MVSVCLPSDALLQQLPSYLDFSYLGHGVRGGSREEQPRVQQAVAERAQEGLEELFHIQGQEGRR